LGVRYYSPLARERRFGVKITDIVEKEERVKRAL